MSDTKPKRDDGDAIAEMRKRYTLASDACRDLYDQAAEDIKFVHVPGNQWDKALKQRRGDRPTYEFPKLRGHVLQVINEMRQARPQGKVRGVGPDDAGLAEIQQGLCRNIEATSNAEDAYDIAAETAVPGGLGWWRICTDYLNDDDLEQDIRIKAVRNFASVKPDPAAIELDLRDARFYFVEELIPRSEFERKYGEDKLKNFDDDQACQADWRDKDQVRIAEYWYKTPVKRELVGLSNGEVIDLADLGEDPDAALALMANPQPDPTTGQVAPPVTVVQRRTVDSHKVCMRLTNGHEFLTDEYEFPSKFIPIVPLWGNIYSVDGQSYWCGMVRYAKDLQRLHNVHRVAIIEAVAKSPKAPFMVKAKWIKGFEKFWNRANAEDYPYLPVADDADGMPQRSQQAEVPVALIQLAGMDNDDMKAGTGQFDASLGNRSNETSGLAINARKQQGSTATFNYPDNLAKAMRFTYEIMGDMIPRVYDTPRVVRILGPDGGEKWKTLYQQVQDPETGQTHTLNDISKGKYDYTVTVGPSFATQRMETAELLANAMSQMGAAAPQFAPLMAYGIMANMDGPGLEEFQTAARKIVVQMGLLPPKEGEQPPAPPQPNPKDIADAQQKQSAAKLNDAKAEGQQLQNMQLGAQLAHAHAMGGMPPPQPPIYPTDQMGPGMQPPNGGFFSPDAQPGPQNTGL
jgi:hypothetical protein